MNMLKAAEVWKMEEYQICDNISCNFYSFDMGETGWRQTVWLKFEEIILVSLCLKIFETGLH